MARLTGTMKRHSANMKSGFIQQDNGDADLFVMPAQCIGWNGQLPELFARITYSIGLDKQKQSPMAIDVVPEQPEAAASSIAGVAGLDASLFTRGSIQKSGDKFGFIQQDDGSLMFVLPGQCQEFFNGAIPPPGTRVAFTVETDAKTGR